MTSELLMTLPDILYIVGSQKLDFMSESARLLTWIPRAGEALENITGPFQHPNK